LTSRLNLEPEQHCSGEEVYQKNVYIWKMQMIFPDGSVRQFVPRNYWDKFGDGYFNVDPNGREWWTSVKTVGGDPGDPVSLSCRFGPSPASTSGMTYVSTDGTFSVLKVDYVPGGNGFGNSWTLYLPGGTKVRDEGGVQTIYDRNGNHVRIEGGVVTDQLGRSITIEPDPAVSAQDHITVRGAGGSVLRTTVRWKDVWVHKQYYTSEDVNALTKRETLFAQMGVVSQISLPQQAGSLSYSFDYSASSHQPGPGNYSAGWGELNSVTLPSGARASYEFAEDREAQSPRQTAAQVIRNFPTKKTLSYLAEHDGAGEPVTEAWSYNIGPDGAFIIGPDGSTTTEFFKSTWEFVTWDSGLVYKSSGPHKLIERVWAQNWAHGSRSPNPYVKSEITTLRDSSGRPAWSAIKDYTYDKNGNLLKVWEYDWVPYGLILHDATGRVRGFSNVEQYLRRVIVNEYYNPTPEASDTSRHLNAFQYALGESCRMLGLLRSSEVRGVSGGAEQPAAARSEYFYDDANLTGNLTRQMSWDSARGAYRSPLTTANSVLIEREYDRYGNLIAETEAGRADGTRSRSRYVYGEVAAPTGAVSGLYPTEINVAYETAVQRTTLNEYDFWTGLVTRSTDADNHVSTSTVYDDLGRPVLVAEAEGATDGDGRSLERRTFTSYDDTQRRVVVRSDLSATGDGRLVSVRHFDQLGRVRLTRTLEDASTQAAADETTGIKVQTRYRYGGAQTDPHSYVLVSNPYRAVTSQGAGGEETMGWTLQRSDSGGRLVRIETFAGAALPAPFAASTPNANSTGAVLTSYDAQATTVTDQAGKQRRGTADALGRLIEVVEAPEATGYNHRTSYQYDPLGNLTRVVQGRQTRSFLYSSLSRLIAATNPEACRPQPDGGCIPVAVSYAYDPNGNLTRKTDARGLAITYQYDALNRLILRAYSDSTPAVTYAYDMAPFGKGRLATVSSSVSTYSLTAYDALGRVRTSTQTTAAHTSTHNYQYNMTGAMTAQQYPSGRVIETSYDAAGRVAGAFDRTTAKSYAGGAAGTSAAINYTAHGAVTSLRLGNQLWEQTGYNSRLQPTRIELGASGGASALLRLEYAYGGERNNGNVLSQRIVVPGELDLQQSYEYDELNRLRRAEERNGVTPVWRQVYGYDAYGNRTLAAGTTLPAALDDSNNPTISESTNRITSAGYSYDAAGNLLCDPAHPCGASGAAYYEYDGENRLRSAGGGAQAGGAEYFYDGDGRRVKKIAGGVTTVFVYDALGRLAAEYTDGQAETGGTKYLTQDHLGSTRVVTDAEKRLRARYDYLPYGEEIGAGIGARSVNLSYSRVEGTRQRFTGHERDDETELDYMQARYYAGRIGRFTSTDPIHLKRDRLVDPQRLNLYVYARNNALKYIDPHGEDIRVVVTNRTVGTTTIRSRTTREIREAERAGSRSANSRQPAYRERTVNVYSVNVTNDSGRTFSFGVTRDSFRDDGNGRQISPERGDYGTRGEAPPGEYRGKFIQSNNTGLSLRIYDPDVRGEATMRAPDGTNRIAIQIHEGHCSEGCPLVRDTSMQSVREQIEALQQEDERNGYGTDIHVTIQDRNNPTDNFTLPQTTNGTIIVRSTAPPQQERKRQEE
jgi:RHS repeat-associated protein